MKVPCEPIIERPRFPQRPRAPYKVVLQSRCKIIRVANDEDKLVPVGYCTEFFCTPEVEVLGHVDLLEDAHQSSLLGRLLNLVVSAYGYHLGHFAMEQVMATKECDYRTL